MRGLQTSKLVQYPPSMPLIQFVRCGGGGVDAVTDTYPATCKVDKKVDLKHINPICALQEEGG